MMLDDAQLKTRFSRPYDDNKGISQSAAIVALLHGTPLPFHFFDHFVTIRVITISYHSSIIKEKEKNLVFFHF